LVLLGHAAAIGAAAGRHTGGMKSPGQATTRENGASPRRNRHAPAVRRKGSSEHYAMTGDFKVGQGGCGLIFKNH
jgi:hypothetical protein